ncbi:MAG TPA: hypothetical protein VNB23_14295 [Ramlibacter sp.]|nr:hypothetical protein [Ramlibacter sp.]
MSPWLLLVLTCACAALAVDAFLMRAPLRDTPARFWPRDGKHGLTLAEQDQVQRRDPWGFAGVGWLGWMFLAMTVLLGILTVRAFWP